MNALTQLLQGGEPVAAHGPWPRITVVPSLWHELADGLAENRWSLMGLWGDGDTVHMALLEEPRSFIAVASLACPDGVFPSIGRRHRPAVRLERALCDLTGLAPDGAPDARPWLDHGRWSSAPPGRIDRPERLRAAASPYPFLPVEGHGLHQIPVGPIHAGIIEPGHFRFTACGETVVRLEERLGYAHKGTEALMRGRSLGDAVRLAGRVSGDSTVAYALAFARAAEAALGMIPPPRAVWLRALMAELERVANHIGDIGAICNDASFSLMHTHCGILRERTLRAAEACFGHRLMMDCILPGGIAMDPAQRGLEEIETLVAEVEQALPRLISIYEGTTSLQDRTVGAGIVTPEFARSFASGGYVGRASGRAFDARRALPYPPYDRLQFTVPTRTEGDVNARVWVRIEEIQQSLGLIRQILAQTPNGAIDVAVPDTTPGGCEGMAVVEAFRGDVLAWLALDNRARVRRCHVRDASWFQWPLLEAAIEGNIVADFPLCNKSFNCSYSGQDL
jgi:Ni,Fe-hydrogenase III large subunit